jgi:hypothetical protein
MEQTSGNETNTEAPAGADAIGDDPTPTGDAASDSADTQQTSDNESNTGTASSEPTTVEETTPVLLPNVVGLIDTEAKDQLLAVGITEVEIIEEQRFGEAGEVLKQQPRAGSTATGTVTLTIRTELPPLPDYVTDLVDGVTEELESWGVEVVVSQTVDESRPEGEVLATVPAAGGQIGQQVELTVAAKPVTVNLGGEGAPLVDSFLGKQRYGYFDPQAEWYDALTQLDGETTLRAVVVKYPSDSDRYVGNVVEATKPTYVEYNLGRDWTTFRTTVGIGDESQAFIRGVFRVFVDGEAIEEHILELGQTVDLEVDVEDALRIRLETEPLILGTGYYVWNNPVVVGAGTGR